MTAKDFATHNVGVKVRFHDRYRIGRLGTVVGYHVKDNQVLVAPDDFDSFCQMVSTPDCVWLTTVPLLSGHGYSGFGIDQLCVVDEQPPISGTVKKVISDFPHRCPRCSAPAFVGVVSANVSCSNRECAYADVKLAPLIVPNWGYTSFPGSSD